MDWIWELEKRPYWSFIHRNKGNSWFHGRWTIFKLLVCISKWSYLVQYSTT